MATDSPLLDIAEVSRRTGLVPSTLRYYEECGLIQSSARRGLRRQYTPDVIDRIAVIVLCQQAGFTLPEVGQVLATDGGPGWRALVESKLRQVERTIADLTTVAEGLTHALGCPSPEVLRCPHFRAELERVLPADAALRKRVPRA